MDNCPLDYIAATVHGFCPYQSFPKTREYKAHVKKYQSYPLTFCNGKEIRVISLLFLSFFTFDFGVGGISPSCGPSICASRLRCADTLGTCEVTEQGRMRFHRSRNSGGVGGGPVSHRCQSGVRHGLLVRRG